MKLDLLKLIHYNIQITCICLSNRLEINQQISLLAKLLELVTQVRTIEHKTIIKNRLGIKCHLYLEFNLSAFRKQLFLK